MRLLRNIIFFLIGIIGLTLANISFSYILPFPFQTMNFPFVSFVLIILWRESGIVVWFAFFSYFLIELFVDIPFGILLFSSTFAILFTFWLYQNVFTNKSWYAAMILGAVSIFLFRTLYVGFLIFAMLFGQVDPSWSNILTNILWELVLTTGIIGIIYPFIIPFSHKKKMYIQ